MSLSCSCDFDGDFEWYYYPPNDYSKLSTTRRVRCNSCNDLIYIGSIIALFTIYSGDGKVQLADRILCEKCSDIYFSLSELGFECVAPNENMIELAKEYHDTYQPKVGS